MKAFWHTEQTNGRSPVCVRMWIWSADVDEKFFVHTLQMCFRDGSFVNEDWEVDWCGGGDGERWWWW